MSRGVLNKEELGVLMMNDPLPNTLSALIMVAVKDAKKLDRTIYSPDSMLYHDTRHSDKCYICDAGAVMSGTLQVDRKKSLGPDEFPQWISNKLYALDLARRGSYVEALIELGVENININGVTGVCVSIHHDYTTWKQFDKHMNVMEKAAQQLKDLGY